MEKVAPKNRTVPSTLGTSNADIYVVPNGYKARITSIWINNTVAASRTFSLDWYESATSTWHTLAEAVELTGNSLLQIENSIYLQSGDKLRALASAASSVSISVFVEEYFLPVQF